MTDTYLRQNAKEKLKEFFRCVEHTKSKLKQQITERNDTRTLKALKFMPSSVSCDLQIKTTMLERVNNLESY